MSACRSISAGVALTGLLVLASPTTVLGGDWASSVPGCTVSPDLLCDPTDTDVDTVLYATSCIRLTVECVATEQYEAETPRSVLLLRHVPARTPFNGTIVFCSSGAGSQYYEDEADEGVRLVESMLEAGFAVIQRKWQGGWPEGLGGMRSLSRHGAAMFDYIRNGPTDFFQGPRFCATGNSGGGAEISYALAHHGFDGGPESVATFDGVVITSGPATSDMVTGCWGDNSEVVGNPLWWDPNDPANPDSPSQLQGTPRPDTSDPDNPVYPFCYDGLDQDGIPFEVDPRDPSLFEAWAGIYGQFAQGVIDSSLGGEILCSLDNPTDLDIEKAAQGNILGRTAVYDYPSTNVFFLFGDRDCGEAVPLGLLYANEISTHIDFIPGVEHLMADSVAGSEAIGEALLRVCGDLLCDGDANRDGTVDPLDGGYVLARLGCAVGVGDFDCNAADQNGDGVVNPLDSGFVLARFGDCP